jgi:hypothetical protein
VADITDSLKERERDSVILNGTAVSMPLILLLVVFRKNILKWMGSLLGKTLQATEGRSHSLRKGLGSSVDLEIQVIQKPSAEQTDRCRAWQATVKTDVMLRIINPILINIK